MRREDKIALPKAVFMPVLPEGGHIVVIADVVQAPGTAEGF